MKTETYADPDSAHNRGPQRTPPIQSNLAKQECHAFRPDLAEPKIFLSTLAPSNTTGRFTFQTFNDVKVVNGDQKPRPRGDKSLAKILHGTIEEHFDELWELNKRGAGIFVTVNETDGKGRREENIISLRSAFYDDDKNADPETSLPLSIKVRSASGIHGYFCLKEGQPLNQFANAQSALAARLDTDPSVKDLPRVMRLPGFYHMKNPSRPVLVKIEYTTDLRYTLDEIFQHYPPSENVTKTRMIPPKVTEKSPRSDGAIQPLDQKNELNARAYLRKTPAAVQGQGGNMHTFKVCSKLTNDFQFSAEDTFRLLNEGWNQRCEPPWPRDELMQIIMNSLKYAKREPGTARDWTPPNEPPHPAIELAKQHNNQPWRPINPLGGISLPQFPIDCFPKILRDYSVALCDAVEVPIELPAAVVLGCVSAANNGKYEVEVRPGYAEPIQLWLSPILESGLRKTGVFTKATKPIYDHEKFTLEAMRPAIDAAEEQRKTEEVVIASLRQQAGRAKKRDARNKLLAEISELLKDRTEVPRPPRYVVGDITTEQLGVVMEQNGECISLLTEEAGILGTIAGRYSQNLANMDLYLQSYSSAHVRVDRGSRPPVMMNNPSLTFVISPQPIAIQSLMERKEFVYRGFIPRFLFFLPKSNLGFRPLDSKPVPEAVERAYVAKIEKLLTLGGGRNEAKD